MLQIKEISKTYKTGELVQKALDSVSINLRDNEFVAVLGPSGSGKTTFLNIVGGLDRYDSGDLIIDNVSTRDYKDRDFDSYRNHSIGFVFQSYNLIPHQNILSNVELALTIAGISKKERRERALKALDQVGLKDQAHKKPNQLSGGQMQRVAIARALVNDPKIVLADEPTGALDTKTSIQVMELLKEVAKDRLVVMVTHNPELANEYANRIVRLQDGHILSDSNPYLLEEKDLKKPEKRNLGKARMSFFTALSLSFNNLLTKKGRTILTAFAGSIGIIGIALILSVSTGFQNYIDKIQEDTLSSYPLSVNSETADTTSAILSLVQDAQNTEKNGDTVTEQKYLTTMFSSIGSNDLTSFKKYLEENEDTVNEYCSLVRYSYSISPQIYTIDAADNLAQINPSSMLSSIYSSSVSSLMSTASSQGAGIFSEIMEDEEALTENYEILAGRWPESYDELIIVLSEPNKISDLLLYSIGLRDTKELKSLMTDIMSGEEIDIQNEAMVLTYEDLMETEMKLIDASDLYKYNEKYDIYEDMSEDEEYMKEVYDKATPLKIVGVVCSKEGSSSMALSTGVGYTRALSDKVREMAAASPIVKKQLENKDVDVFSGNRFDEEEESEEIDFEDMISIDEEALSDAFKLNIDFSSFSDTEGMSASIINRSNDIVKALDELSTKTYESIVSSFSDAASKVVQSYSDSFSYNVPNSCPLGYAQAMNPLSGCALPEESDKTYRKYRQVQGFSTDPSDPTMIYVYKKDYSTYVSFNDVMTAAYKSMAITEDTLQKEALVNLTSSVFDEYVAKAKALVDSGDMTALSLSAVKKEDLDTISLDDIIKEKLMDAENRLAIQNLVTETTEQYTSLLIAKGMGEEVTELLKPLTSADGEIMSIDSDKFAGAFTFTSDQDELSRIMTAMVSGGEEASYSTNLINLGYQEDDDPTTISFYFKDFDSKEAFLDFIDEYNSKVEEEKEISYTDITGLLMSSVKTIVDSVSYVLIAFVSISLVVSSIMIAVITLISVMERTKEIGILRAMGASKHNVSSIFNAETFIIGLLSGLLGVGTSLAVIPVINKILHSLTNNYDISAALPANAATVLVLISIALTVIAGIIPSRKAAKQDPVIALRSE